MITDVTFHPSWWNKKLSIDFSKSFFFNPRIRLEADQEMRRELFRLFGNFSQGDENPEKRPIWGTDLLASGFFYSALAGCDIRYGADIPPEVLSPKITSEQALTFTAPELDKHPLWLEAMEDVRCLKERYGSVISAINLQGVLNLAIDLRGEDLMTDFFINPEAASNLINQLTLLTIDIGRRIHSFSDEISGGVTAVVNRLPFLKGLYVHSNCSIEMISNELYENFLLESDNMLSNNFQPYGIHHCGASMEHVTPGYARIRNLSFAEIGAGSDIAAVRKALPDTHLNLRYSPVKLAAVTESDLMKELAAMADAAGRDKMSFSCVGIDNSVSDSQTEMYLHLGSSI